MSETLIGFPQVVEMITYLFGGLSVFLLGMKYLSDGVQATAGDRLSRMIAMVTDNRLAACGTGIFVTGLIQSSSITTVMLVGLVNAGVMNLTQSIGVILGADIGTTVTAWIVAVKVTKYGLLMVGVSGLLYLFTRHERTRFVAMLVMGLGMVFFGLQLMEQGVAPLRCDERFTNLLARFSPTTYWGVIKCVLIGSAVTGVIQSSSATIAITITLARAGIVDFDTSVALVLGQNIGTTVTAFLGSLGMSVQARRVAYAHIIIKIAAVALMIPFFFLYMDMLGQILNANTGIATRIALAHTVFNVLLVLAFLPFTKQLARLLTLVFRDRPLIVPKLTHLDIRMLEAPLICLEQSRREILQMGAIVGEMMNTLREIEVRGVGSCRQLVADLFAQEERLDVMQKEVVVFLTRLLTQEISTAVAKETHEQLRRADEYESISDYCASILKLHLRLSKAGIELDEDDNVDVLAMHDAVYAYYQMVYAAHEKRDLTILTTAYPQGDALKHQFKEVRSRHLAKLHVKQLDPLICTLYPDILNGYRRIKEHLINVAEAVAGVK